MNVTHDVHLIFNGRDEDAVARIEEELRRRGLIPWFWRRDAGPNFLEDELASITQRTPVSAVFLGPAGWSLNFHRPFAEAAFQSGRPTILVLLPGWHADDVGAFPALGRRRWVEFKTLDERSSFEELAQQVVDGAYEAREEPAEEIEARQQQERRGRRLMVYVPARSLDVDSWNSLRNRLSSEPDLRDCVWYGHSYAGPVWSRQSVEDLAVDLVPAIAAALGEANRANAEDPIEHITLMGHSFGGVLARMAYLIAAGQYLDKQRQESSWWRLVDRVVLFAAPNQGIEERRFDWQGRLAARWPFGRAGQLTRDQLVGSEAITNLRIRWVRFFATLRPNERPIVVQFLARGDELVKREDSLDIEQFPNAWQSDVPGASHGDLHQIPAGDDARYDTLRQGILEAKPVNLPEGTSRRRNPVVVVLHGMRANNETWAEQVKTQIDRRAPNAYAVAPTYGYFPMLDFALPWLRAKKARALQALYSDLLVRYPRARFCFVGHSNGTYMLGRSLLNLAGMRFDRVTLAASVLPRDYEWSTCFLREQVREVSNHRAAGDVPVGIVCNLLRSIGMRDVGTAGFHGFLGGREEIKEVYYYTGGHGAPVAVDNVESLVEYTLTGRGTFPLATETTPRAPFVSRLSESTIIGLGVFALFCGILLGMTWVLFTALTLMSLSAISAGAIAATVVLVGVYW